MDCARARETIALAEAGELDEELARELARHLDSCSACREEEAALRGVAASFRESVPMPDAAARRGMRERVMGEVRAKPERAAGRRRPSALRRRMRAPRARQFAWMLPLAAAASVLVVWAVYFRGPDEDARAPAVAGREAPPAADGVVEGIRTEESPAGTVAARPEELPAPAEEKGPAAEERVELAGLEEAEAAPAAEGAAPSRVVSAPDETPQVLASIAQIEGLVHYRRGGGKWNRAVEGIRLVGGDELDTRTGLAAVALEEGGRVLCSRGSWAAFEAGKVHLHRGEVFCEFDPAGGIAVSTADGVVRHVGTRFSVKVLPAGTVVTVEEGSVMVECGGAAARVREGFQLKLRRGLAPGRPRRLDAGKALAWVRGLRPRVLYTMESPSPAVTRVPGVGPVQTLEGWSFKLGEPWAVTEAPRPEPGLGARRWQPARRGDYRSHAVVGEPTWADYEVAFAFRVAPGSIGGTANSVSAIVYQGEDQLDVYRLGVWGLHGPDAKLRCVRGFGGNTTTELPWRMAGGGKVQVRPGSWYRVRFGVRTRRDRVELRGKLWPAASREPKGWSCIAVDRSAERLASGRAGVGLQGLHAEVTEFAVKRLADW